MTLPDKDTNENKTNNNSIIKQNLLVTGLAVGFYLLSTVVSPVIQLFPLLAFWACIIFLLSQLLKWLKRSDTKKTDADTLTMETQKPTEAITKSKGSQFFKWFVLSLIGLSIFCYVIYAITYQVVEQGMKNGEGRSMAAVSVEDESPVKEVSSEDLEKRLLSQTNETELIMAHNEERSRVGLYALARSDELTSSACDKANHMIDNNYWDHDSPDGIEPWVFFENNGYYYQEAGENLSYGFKTDDQVMQGWLDSKSHYSNVVSSKFSDIGICTVFAEEYYDASNVAITVAHFGTR